MFWLKVIFLIFLIVLLSAHFEKKKQTRKTTMSKTVKIKIMIENMNTTKTTAIKMGKFERV